VVSIKPPVIITIAEEASMLKIDYPIQTKNGDFIYYGENYLLIDI
jgi:hypothetical protein